MLGIRASKHSIGILLAVLFLLQNVNHRQHIIAFICFFGGHGKFDLTSVARMIGRTRRNSVFDQSKFSLENNGEWRLLAGFLLSSDSILRRKGISATARLVTS